MQQMPDPRPGPSEVVVRVKATSLCGTDAHIYNWDEWARARVRVPRIIGHEMCGEVADLGPGVASVAVGDYVAGTNHVLPTGGSARWSSGLGVADFVKRIYVSGLEPTSLERLADHVDALADAEGLNAHGRAVRIRLGQDLDLGI